MRALLIAITLVFVGPLSAGAALPAPPEALRSSVELANRGDCNSALEALRPLAAEPTPIGGRAVFLLGDCLLRLGRYGEAREAFVSASQRHATLAALARVRAARAALLDGDAPAAVDLAGSPRNASVPVVREGQLVLAEALRLTGRPREAVTVARALVRGHPPDGVLAEGWWLFGRAAEAAGDAATAIHAYGMAWWAIPQSSHAAEAVAVLRRLSGGRAPIPPAEARAQRGLRLIASGEQKAAEQDLAIAVKGTLPDALAAEAWYQLGLLRVGRREAVMAFQQAARFRDERDRALFWWGQALMRIGRGGEGRSVWRRLLREFPQSLWSARSVAALGRSAEAGGRLEHADRWYEIVVRQFPRSPRADDARWRRAWIRYRTRRYSEARLLFERYGRTSPEAPRAAAHLYWAWRTRQQVGAPDNGLLRTVAQHYPMTFYGQRARARLGLPAPARRDGPTRVLSPAAFHPAHEELAALGLYADALAEVEAVSGDDPPRALLRAAAELHARSGNVPASIAATEPLINRALYGGETVDVELWRLAYPRAYWGVIVPEAARHRLDPLLLLALIREESRFDPRAVSPAGAIGLMQLLPSTAGGILGAPVGAAQLMDPGVNVRAGTAYLAGLLLRFEGTLPAAVGGYNAGPGGVRRFADLARLDLDRFVEGLPYAETRAYVQRVLQSYGIYRWLYE